MAFRDAHACRATSASISTETTFPGPSRCASSAAFQPVPVPISSTRMPGRTSRSRSIRTTTEGAEAEDEGQGSDDSRPSLTWVTIGTSA